MDLTLRIAGEAGQGIVSVGEMLCAAFVKSGLHVLTGQSYMSRIRGGLNWFDIRVARRGVIRTPREAEYARGAERRRA